MPRFPSISMARTRASSSATVGRRLASLQFVVNFILSRKAQDRVNIRVDVEGYRDRREESLRTMANRMMERAVSTGRTVHMEPMPARERRIVHMALSSSRKVSTESVGEGEARKVTIIPKPGGGGRPGGAGPVYSALGVGGGQRPQTSC